MSASKRRKLNGHGVKASTDMWRTFNGAHYAHWTVQQYPDQAATYRNAGVRCRRVGDEIFVHEDDREAARRVDSEVSQ